MFGYLQYRYASTCLYAHKHTNTHTQLRTPGVGIESIIIETGLPDFNPAFHHLPGSWLGEC